MVKEALQNLNFNKIYSYSLISTALWEKFNLNTKELVKIPNALPPELDNVEIVIFHLY